MLVVVTYIMPYNNCLGNVVERIKMYSFSKFGRKRFTDKGERATLSETKDSGEREMT